MSSSSASTGNASGQSRYERVKAILNAAQGEADPSYQGHTRFWEMPLERLLTLELYGIRMIAPKPSNEPSGSSECGCGIGGGDSPCSDPGRGAASGLVQGLKGEPPFDDSQFPRLPWGGSEVSAADIAFIEQWIDDDCPTTDSLSARLEVSQSSTRALTLGLEAHPLCARVSNAVTDEVAGVKVRKNIDALLPDELSRLRAAIAQMHTLDDYYQDERSYDYWARIHASNCQHSWEEFLTWHRAYLYLFEKQLQDIDPTITLPYWNWSTYNQGWANTNASDTGELPLTYGCFVDQGVLDALKGKIPDITLVKLTAIQGKAYNSGPRLFQAAGIPWGAENEPILAALEAANPLWHRFRWPGGTASTLFENYPRPSDDANLLAIPGWFAFGSGPRDNHFYGALEKVHNLMHLFTGGPNPNYDSVKYPNPQNRIEPQFGDMFSNSTTSFDPFFWSLHGNVDRMWDAWQQKNPGADPANPDDILPPFNMSVADTISIKTLGYEYQLASSIFETNPSMPLLRFRSAKAQVSAQTLAAHTRAEVRIHGVRYSLEGGGLLHVFLNAPDANETTPTRGNERFVGFFPLFAGGCVGGPGHCSPPRRPALSHDKRARHRKTPGNIHLDATQTIKALRAKGENDYAITVVALGSDGKPRPDLLKMSAASLVFFD